MTQTLGDDQLEDLHAEAEAKLAELEDEAAAFNDALRIDASDLDLPDAPEIPKAELAGISALADPLISSAWGFAEQCRRLIAHKAYIGGE